MKKRLAVLLLAVMATGVFAEEQKETTEHKKDECKKVQFHKEFCEKYGFSAGINIDSGNLEGNRADLAGMKLSVNTKDYTVSLAGYKLLTDTKLKGDTDKFLDMCYGGIEADYTALNMGPVQLKTGALIGMGQLSAREGNWTKERVKHKDGDKFYVVEPHVGVDVKVFENVKITGSVGYLFCKGIGENPNYKDENFNGLNARAGIEVGVFK